MNKTKRLLTLLLFVCGLTSGAWAVISNSGTSLGYGSSNLGNSTFYFGNTATMRLVCDY